MISERDDQYIFVSPHSRKPHVVGGHQFNGDSNSLLFSPLVVGDKLLALPDASLDKKVDNLLPDNRN